MMQIMNFLRIIKDCNRLIAASEPKPTKAAVYLFRLAMAWQIGHHAAFIGRYHHDPSPLEMKDFIFLELLLLLLLVSCRSGRLPIMRMPVQFVSFGFLTGCLANHITKELVFLQTYYALLPDWKVYLYVFLIAAAWMFISFVISTITLLAAKDGVAVMYRSPEKKGPAKKVFAMLCVPFIAWIVTAPHVSVLHSLLDVWTIRIISFSATVLTGLALCRMLFLCRNHLQSIGKIA